MNSTMLCPHCQQPIGIELSCESEKVEETVVSESEAVVKAEGSDPLLERIAFLEKAVATVVAIEEQRNAKLMPVLEMLTENLVDLDGKDRKLAVRRRKRQGRSMSRDGYIDVRNRRRHFEEWDEDED